MVDTLKRAVRRRHRDSVLPAYCVSPTLAVAILPQAIQVFPQGTLRSFASRMNSSNRDWALCSEVGSG